MSFDWSGAESVRIDGGNGLVLREWTTADIEALVLLYNTEEMHLRTPVPYPFTEVIARSYVEKAGKGRADGTLLQLAITEPRDGADGADSVGTDLGGQDSASTDMDTPIGEMLIAATGDPAEVELAYAVGQAAAGRGIATRSIGLAVDYLLRTGLPAGVERAIVRVAQDNPKSWRAAEANGFLRTDRPVIERTRKGITVELVTWVRDLDVRGT